MQSVTVGGNGYIITSKVSMGLKRQKTKCKEKENDKVMSFSE